MRLSGHFVAADTRYGTIAMAVNLSLQAAVAQEMDWSGVYSHPVYWTWKRSMTASLPVHGTISICMLANDTKKEAASVINTSRPGSEEDDSTFFPTRTPANLDENPKTP